jgi:hypothetical protein
MPRYEYKVVPAPKKAAKVKGLKGTDQLFAASLSDIMNRMGADGWEYQRSDTLPCEERHGLTGRVTTFQNMLIFCRKIETEVHQAAPVQVTESEPMLAVPTFRSTTSGQPQVSLDRPEGAAPRLGGARHPDPSTGTRAPDIAAQ